MDRSKFQFEGLKWLFELELLNHPQAINQIRFGILMVSKRIKEVELLIYRENKTMLVLLNLTWIGRTFFKRAIFTEVQEVLNQLLPSFNFRVTDNPKIMEMAVERVKQALSGGKNENSKPNVSSSVSLVEQPSESTVDAVPKDSNGVGTSPESSPEKQSETTETVRQNSSPDDSKKE